MTLCPTCGADNPEGARFCNACGERLEPTSATGQEAPSGERRVVTMLLCDVRGSTAMAEGLDPEDWTDVMNEAFTLRRRARAIVEEISAGLSDADLQRRFLSRDDVHALEAVRR